MEGKSLEYYFGFVAGALATFLLIFVIVRVIKRQEGAPGGKKEYDERQQLARGKAYRAGFWSLVGYMFVNAVITDARGPWADSIITAMTGVLFATTVFVVICIRQDAYFPLNAKYGYYLKLFTFILFVNVLVSVMNILTGQKLIENGVVTYHALNLMLVVMYMAVIPVMVSRHRKERGAEDEE